jgi:hypothetical protein
MSVVWTPKKLKKIRGSSSAWVNALHKNWSFLYSFNSMIKHAFIVYCVRMLHDWLVRMYGPFFVHFEYIHCG